MKRGDAHMICRIMKLNNYTVIANDCIRDPEISLKAKGLHTLMMSLPDDWNYSVKGLKSICKESDRSIETALAELKKFGYLTVEKLPPRPGQPKIGYVYTIYEVPVSEIENGKYSVEVQNVGLHNQGVQNVPLDSTSQGVHSVGVQNEGVHLVGVQNDPQLNTNILNTNKPNKDRLSTDKEPRSEKTGYALILELYNNLCPSLPKVTVLNNSRKQAIKERAGEYSLEDFKTVFRKAEASDFCKGKKGSWRGANLDWLLNRKYFARTLAGNYDNDHAPGCAQEADLPPTENIGEIEQRFMELYENGGTANA
ncbi:MAG: helix-turn-helix domain-containing protein [Candidatus Ornithomonoglobus sp.]